MEWWQTFLISTIPAIFTGTISGVVSYISAIKKSESELEKSKIEYEKQIESIRETSKAEKEKMKLELDLKIEEMDKEKNYDRENKNEEAILELTKDVFTGKIKMDDLVQLQKQAEKFRK